MGGKALRCPRFGPERGQHTSAGPFERLLGRTDAAKLRLGVPDLRMSAVGYDLCPGTPSSVCSSRVKVGHLGD